MTEFLTPLATVCTFLALAYAGLRWAGLLTAPMQWERQLEIHQGKNRNIEPGP